MVTGRATHLNQWRESSQRSAQRTVRDLRSESTSQNASSLARRQAQRERANQKDVPGLLSDLRWSSHAVLSPQLSCHPPPTLCS
jgi:hypothetical protein